MQDSSNQEPPPLPPEKMGLLAQAGAGLADWSERWFPDSYIFAAIALVIVSFAALFMGRNPMQIGVDFWQVVLDIDSLHYADGIRCHYRLYRCRGTTGQEADNSPGVSA